MKANLTTWQKFAIRFSGFDPFTASYSPAPVVNKITGLASIVALPCFVAIFSYAMLCYFFKPDPNIAIYAGLAASVLIYILERSIMKYGRGGTFSIGFLSRILIAVTSGWIAAEVLVIGLSGGVIKQQQFSDLSQAKDSIRVAYVDKINVHKNEIKSGQAHIDSMLIQYNLEVMGERSREGAGKGPIARDLKNQYDGALKNFDSIQAKANNYIAGLEMERDVTLANLDSVQSTDFIARLEALDKIEKQHPKTNFILWIFRIFLLSVELFPLMMKLSIGKDLQPYYDIQDSINRDALKSFDILNKQRTMIESKKEEVQFHKELYDLGKEELKNVTDAQTVVTKQQINEAINLAKFKDQQVQSLSGKLELETFADAVGDIEKIYDRHRTGSLEILDLSERIHSSNVNTATSFPSNYG